MKKILIFFIILCFFAVMAVGCRQGTVTDNTDAVLTTENGQIDLKTYNSISEAAIFDRNYTVEGANSVDFTAAEDGCVFQWYVGKDKTEIKNSFSVSAGDKCLIPTNGCAVYVKDASPSESFSVDGYQLLSFIDLYTYPSVTDLTETVGFLLSHKDPVSFDGVVNAFFSATSTSVKVPDGYLGVNFTRSTNGVFSTKEFGVEKTDARKFTLMISDAYAKGFANDVMKKEDYYVNNTDLLSPYGTDEVLAIGNVPITVDGINPEKAQEGVFIYDERYGFGVTPQREEPFVDLLVFDGVVAYIGEENKNTVLPYPMGYAVCFNGKENVEKVKDIKVGDTVETLLFQCVTTPADYVLLCGEHIIETVYKNEARTAEAPAVLYDSNFFWDSTRTNIWGAEAAFDKDGVLVSVNKMGLNGISGNTDIPDGGFVVSSGKDIYASYIQKLKIGDTAEHVVKDTAYLFRRIENVLYGKEGEGEYITVLSGISKTPAKENAFELSVDKDGYIISASQGGNTSVPEGGCVISSTGAKMIELKRYYKIGYRVIFNEKSSRLYVFGTAQNHVDQCTEEIKRLENEIASAREKLLLIDYEYAYELLDQAKELSAQCDASPEKLFELRKTLETLGNVCVPSFFVQDRAAWVVHYETDADDVAHTVEYAHSLGLNTLIVTAVKDNYVMYNTEVPHLMRHPDLDEDTDILQEYVDQCHARGMKVYFMHCCFTTSKPSDAFPEEHYVNYFKDKLLISKQGRDVAYFYDTPSYTLNPYDSEVRDWTLEIIREVCENYDIDGVQLDYIRFPLPTYYGESNYEDHGYNEDIMAAFNKKHGTDLDLMAISTTHPMWQKWREFRCDIITSFAQDVSKTVREYGITFSCTCFASHSDRIRYVFQDVESWVEKGIIDEIYPMIYSPTVEGQVNYGEELKEIVGDNCRIILGIGTYDGETDEVILGQVAYSHQTGAAGNSVFALQYIQNFNFDDVYSNKLYRNPAVRTDEYGETVKGYCKQLEFLLTEVCGYLFEEDYSQVLQELNGISQEHGSFSSNDKSDFEKKEFLKEVINSFSGLTKLLDENSQGAEVFEYHVNSITDSLKKLENTLR